MRPPRHASTLLSQALNVSDPADQPSPAGDTVECPPPSRFDFMFPELQTEEALLAEDYETVQGLVRLGRTMVDPNPQDRAFDTDIPSIYTYFGQFIVHDLTSDPRSATRLFEEDLETLKPFSHEEIKALQNPRRGLLDLDSVYGPIIEDIKCSAVPVRENGSLRVEVAVDGTVLGTDLPRAVSPPFKARIGDPRNDENLVLSQLHLSFMRAHNVLVSAGASYEEARNLLLRRYQHLVINDYLPKFVAEADIEWVRKKKIFNPRADGYFMPVEFSAAAFRFGHALIRSEYHYNALRKVVRLPELFTMRVLTEYHHILTDWVVDWTGFVSGEFNAARNLAPRVVEPLAEFLAANITVPVAGGQRKKPIFSLAVIDLLRGYMFRLPTGQVIAKKLDVKPLSEAEIESVAAAVSEDQVIALRASNFTRHTPLWYYILAEAAYRGNGKQLGPVGGRLVASVLCEAAQRSHTPAFVEDGWDPILGPEEGFNLAALLHHAEIKN